MALLFNNSFFVFINRLLIQRKITERNFETNIETINMNILPKKRLSIEERGEGIGRESRERERELWNYGW